MTLDHSVSSENSATAEEFGSQALGQTNSVFGDGLLVISSASTAENTTISSGNLTWNSPSTEQQSNWQHYTDLNSIGTESSHVTLSSSMISQSKQLWGNDQERHMSGDDVSCPVGVATSGNNNTSAIWQGLSIASRDWEVSDSSGLQGIGQWGSQNISSSLWSAPVSTSIDITMGSKIDPIGSGDSSVSGGGSDPVSRDNWGAPWGGSGSGPCSWPESENDGGGNGSNHHWSEKSLSVDEATTPSLPPTKEELLRRAKEEEFNKLLNNNTGWGQRRIDQSTLWDVGDSRDNRKQIDTMVWNHEPNNGTGIWETFYEQQGSLPAHWQQSQGEGNWGNEFVEVRNSGTEWGDQQWNNPGWKESSNASASFNWPASGSKLRGGSVSSWTDDPRTGATGGWGGNGRVDDWTRHGTDSEWASQPNTPNTPLPPGGRSGSQWNDRSDDGSTSWKGSSGWDANVGSSSWTDKKDWNNDSSRRPQGNLARGGGRQPEMRSQALKSLMDLGFAKQDALNALITHNMDLDSAMQDLMNSRMNERVSNDAAPRNTDMSGVSAGARLHNIPAGSAFPTVSGSAGVPGNGVGQAQSVRHNLNQQEMMRQQIIQQLRYAVQNRLLSPNMLISTSNNMTPKDLKLIQQLVQAQSSLTKLTHQRNQMLRQMQMSNPHNQIAIQTLQAQLQYYNQIIERTQTQISMLSKSIQTAQQESTAAVNSSGVRDDGTVMADSMSMLRVSSSGEMVPPQGFAGGPRVETSRIANWKLPSPDDSNGKPLHSSQSQTNLINHAQAAARHAAAAAYNRSISLQAASGGANSSEDYAGGQPGGVSGVMDNIPEFVPGQPWHGNFKDDPSLTPAAMSNMLGVRSEHLAGLTNSGDVGVMNGVVMGAAAANNNNNYGTARGNHRGGNGGGGLWMGDNSSFSRAQQSNNVSSYAQNWILIRNLQSNISLEVLKMVCTQQGQVLGMHSHPNGLWTLVRFGSPDEAAKTHRQLSSIPCGEISQCGDQEAQRLMQEVAHALPPMRYAGGAWDSAIGGGSGMPHSGNYDDPPNM